MKDEGRDQQGRAQQKPHLVIKRGEARAVSGENTLAAAERVVAIRSVAEAVAGEGEAICAVLLFGVGLVRDPLDQFLSFEVEPGITADRARATGFHASGCIAHTWQWTCTGLGIMPRPT